MKHVCFNWLPNWPRASIWTYSQRFWRLFCRLRFGEDCIGYLHKAVKNLSSELVHHRKAGDEHLYAIQDKIVVSEYVGLERPKSGSLFDNKYLLRVFWFVGWRCLLRLVSLELWMAERDDILGGVRHWDLRPWSVDSRVFLGSVPVMKPFFAKRNCIFCTVDVWVDLNELGLT